MRDKLGRILEGSHISLKTEFKKGNIVPKGKNHWSWKTGRIDKTCLI